MLWTQSGLKINDTKRELCLFHQKNQLQVTIQINDYPITGKPHTNVLRETFDSKLNWQAQISKTNSKAKGALYAINLIKKHFNKTELCQIITSNYYSIKYYNSEIWHLPSLNLNLKKKLMSASAWSLKLCTPSFDLSMPFSIKRATPPEMMKYKLSLMLHKLYNDNETHLEWVDLFSTKILMLEI